MLPPGSFLLPRPVLKLFQINVDLPAFPNVDAKIFPEKAFVERYIPHLMPQYIKPANFNSLTFCITMEASVECVGRKIRYGQHLPERGASPS